MKRTGSLTLAAVCALAFVAALGWALYLRGPAQSSGSRASAFVTVPSAVDIGFSQAMSVHHQQAVYISQVVSRDRGISSEVRALANTIEAAQLQEIGWMGGWLALWNEPAIPPRGSPMAWMTTNAVYYCGLHHDTMPGLATQPEINRLSTLSGRSADVFFLQLMLRHHEGGIEMALYADRYGQLQQVRDLATRIVLDQTQEVTLIDRLLALDHAKALPFALSPALAHSNAGQVLNETPSMRTVPSLANGWSQ